MVLKGVWIEMRELIIALGSGLFIHLHFRHFDEFFGFSVTSENKLFVGTNPVLSFKGKIIQLS